MLPTISLVICLVVSIIGIETTRIKTFYGIQTKEYPKSSCNEIPNIISKNECLGHCVITVNKIVMISHDESTHTCMCCNDFTGSNITRPNWKSYVPFTCKYLIIQFNQKKFSLKVTYTTPLRKKNQQLVASLSLTCKV